MSPNYRCFRLLLVSFSYFYLLELSLTHNLKPSVPAGMEYFTWLGVGLLIFFLAWLITNRQRAEVSAGLWLLFLFSALWLDFHRQQLAGFGLKRLILILVPCLIFLGSFLLWLSGLILERFSHLKNHLMISSLMLFPVWILLYRESVLEKGVPLGLSLGGIILFASALASVLVFGVILSWLSSFRLFSLSKLWLILVLPTAFFAFYGPVRFEIMQRKPELKSRTNLPDLILISIDTLRADHLGIYGQTKFKTPNFDQLGNDSVVFENAFSPSNWTIPAVASWFTGKWPHQHKAGRIILDYSPEENFSEIAHHLPTLAEQLKKLGYYTVAFVDNAWLRELGFPRGFDYYFLFYPPVLDQELIGLKLDKAIYYLFTGRYQDPGARWLTDRAINWLKAHREKKPIFLWVHYFDPHTPYRLHSEYPIKIKTNPKLLRILRRTSPEFIRAGYYLSEQNQQYIHERYNGEVVYTDQHLGRLLKALEAEGRYFNSVIILTSDHGEEFWEHGSFEHGHSFFQELIKVPLFLKFPGNKNAGERILTPVSTAQIYSTLLQFGRANPEPQKARAGTQPGEFPDLLSIRENPNNSLKLLFSEFTYYFDLKGALINSELKKVILGAKGEKVFFDLVNDPEEKMPLSEAEIPLSLSEQELPEPGELEKAQLRPETQRSLKALGYLQ